MALRPSSLPHARWPKLPWRMVLPVAWGASGGTWLTYLWMANTAHWERIHGYDAVSSLWYWASYLGLPILAFVGSIGGLRRIRVPQTHWCRRLPFVVDGMLLLLNITLLGVGLLLYPLFILIGFPFRELRMSTTIPDYTVTIMQRFDDIDSGYYHTVTVTRADGASSSWPLNWLGHPCWQFTTTVQDARTYIRCDHEPITAHTMYVDRARLTLYTGWASQDTIYLQQVPYTQPTTPATSVDRAHESRTRAPQQHDPPPNMPMQPDPLNRRDFRTFEASQRPRTPERLSAGG